MDRSLGVTMYEIVVGRTPFEKDETEGILSLPGFYDLLVSKADSMIFAGDHLGTEFLTKE